MKARKPAHSLLISIVVITCLLLAAGVAYLAWPASMAFFPSQPGPATDYAAAVQQVETLQAAEQVAGINPVCQTQLLTHGQQTARSVVLIHGYTSCPAQYVALAAMLYDLGYNVLVAPLPHHGLQDRMNEEQSLMTGKELVAYADQVVDIAHGLGEAVSVVGISVGGVTAAWIAQQRPDVERVVVISPAFGLAAVPAQFTLPASHVFLALPNSYRWWSDTEKEAGGHPYAYPRLSTRSLANVLYLGQAVLNDVRQHPPAAGSVVVVSNANDQAVNAALLEQFSAAWRASAPGKLQTFQFPAGLKLDHDIIDPNSPQANTAAVYPQLLELIQAPAN